MLDEPTQRISNAQPTDSLEGTLIRGRYRVHEEIGSGGMGCVYRAMTEPGDLEVAIKVVNAVALRDPTTLKRFETEAAIIASLDHPATLKLIDYGNLDDGRPFLVTELLRGMSLDAVLDVAPLPPARALSIIAEICDSLAEAHDKGIVHRDLKPENIFLEEQGDSTIVRVLDFGIAKLSQTRHTATGMVCGTPTYMSPEQAQGHPADWRSDIYSLGVLAYRAMTGVCPFEGEQPLSILLQHIQDQPRPIEEVMAWPELPYEIKWLVHAMLDKEPGGRPGSVVEVRDHIAHILQNVVIPPGPSEFPTFRPDMVPPQPKPAHLTPRDATPMPMAFAGSAPASIFEEEPPSASRLFGLGFIGFAISIAAAAFMWSQSSGPDPKSEPAAEQVMPTPADRAGPLHALPVADPKPMTAEAKAKPKSKPASEARKTTKKRAVSKKKRKKSTTETTSAKSKKTTKSKPKKEKTEVPKGFVDFDFE